MTKTRTGGDQWIAGGKTEKDFVAGRVVSSGEKSAKGCQWVGRRVVKKRLMSARVGHEGTKITEWKSYECRAGQGQGKCRGTWQAGDLLGTWVRVWAGRELDSGYRVRTCISNGAMPKTKPSLLTVRPWPVGLSCLRTDDRNFPSVAQWWWLVHEMVRWPGHVSNIIKSRLGVKLAAAIPVFVRLGAVGREYQTQPCAGTDYFTTCEPSQKMERDLGTKQQHRQTLPASKTALPAWSNSMRRTKASSLARFLPDWATCDNQRVRYLDPDRGRERTAPRRSVSRALVLTGPACPALPIHPAFQLSTRT